MVLSIYFPKQVAIENPRLWVMQNCCSCATAFIVLVMLVYTKVGYVNQVLPESLITAWVETPAVSYPSGATAGLRFWSGSTSYAPLAAQAAAGAYDFTAASPYSYSFSSPTMAPPCQSADAAGSHTTLNSCVMNDFPYFINKGESIESRFTEETLFIPTAYNEEIYMPGYNYANCALTTGKITGDSTLCKSKNSYLIPGIEDMRILFFHHYAVQPPPSTYHKVFKIDRTIKGSLAVSLRDSDDNRITEFAEEEIVNVSLRELLTPVGLNLDSASGLISNTITASASQTQLASSARIRVTGAQITMNADYRNEMFVRGPVCDVEVNGYAAMTGVTKVDIMDVEGTIRTRTYSGVRVRFIRKGVFDYFQLSEMIFSVTTFIVWIRLPGFAVFYFSVFFLGTLSRIYTRFLYEDLNLNNEFNGVSSRLLKRAHGFADLHDLVQKDGTRAISLGTVKKRMARILAGRRELDEAERDLFTNFYFSKICSKVGEEGELAIVLESYLQAVTSEENLRYDDLMTFVDVDAASKSNFLEKFFQDASLKKFMKEAARRREIAQAQEAEERASQTGAVGGEADDGRESLRKSSARKSAAAEKQSCMLQSRITGQKLSMQLDKLEKELEDVRQMNEKVQTRHNDFLHYLAFLNDQTQEKSRASKKGATAK
jgi:hypothetical protein